LPGLYVHHLRNEGDTVFKLDAQNESDTACSENCFLGPKKRCIDWELVHPTASIILVSRAKRADFDRAAISEMFDARLFGDSNPELVAQLATRIVHRNPPQSCLIWIKRHPERV
jgi:hypothetical protein